MTAQDARERARGAIIRIYDIIEATASKNEQHAAVDSAVAEFDLQWRAAKRDYEERIAALVEVVRRFTLYLDDRGHDEYGALAKEFGPVEVSGSSISTEAWLDRVLRNPALRALAGQTEAMSAE